MSRLLKSSRLINLQVPKNGTQVACGPKRVKTNTVTSVEMECMQKKTISQECFVIEDLISSLDPPRIFFNRLPLIRWPAPPLSPVRTFPDRPAMGNLACRVAFR